MKLLKKNIAPHKKIIIVVLALLLVMSGVIFGLKIFNDKQIDSWIAEVKTTIDDHSSRLSTESSAQEAEEVLLSLQNQLEGTNQPGFILIDFGRKDYSSFSDYLNSLITQIKDFNLTISYQRSLTGVISNLNNLTSENLKELNSTKSAWSKSIEDMEAVQAPEDLQNFHASLVQQFSSINQDISQLVELFKKEDRSGFLAKQDEINLKIDKLHNSGAEFKEILENKDISLSNSLISIMEY